MDPPNVEWRPDSLTEQEDCCQFNGFDFQSEQEEQVDVEDEFKDFWSPLFTLEKTLSKCCLKIK